ncbi:Hypothetical predicted protein [Mytilus galloprovincialis]|uniref:Uncharacterized protein n=1 Tax=Mytilus galloprovincialis TaxID=29158 RepID=A0A8B6HMV5_MYTGA|nr:Hypothetical predicted protein [Mytilus galloprovincialis]
MKYSFTLLVVLYSYVVAGSSKETESSHDDGQLNRVRRGGLSMLRLGRGLQMLRLGKRAMPMLRLGRGVESYTPEEIRVIINTLIGEERGDRQVPLPRYGKDVEVQMLLQRLLGDPQFQERRSMSLYDADDDSPRLINPGPRPGKYRYRRSLPDVPPQNVYDEEKFEDIKEKIADIKDEVKDSEERTVPLPRFGRYLTEDDYVTDLDEEKRAMPMLRLGRAMAMLRLGKRAMHMLRLGKRPMNMLRLGRSDGSLDDEEEKRAMPMLRLGKRPFKMLRLGKRYDNTADDAEIKRNLRMMRLGRGSDKRAMPMLRLGRSQQ